MGSEEIYKKGWSQALITSINWSKVFQKVLKGGEERRDGSFAWRNFDYSMLFVMVKIRFSNHRLIKIGMIYLYRKPEVKKIIQQQWLQLQMKLVLDDYMKIAIWWKHSIMYYEHWTDNRKCFYVFLPKVRGKQYGSPYMVEATRKIKGGDIFLVRWEIQE